MSVAFQIIGTYYSHIALYCILNESVDYHKASPNYNSTTNYYIFMTHASLVLYTFLDTVRQLVLDKRDKDYWVYLVHHMMIFIASSTSYAYNIAKLACVIFALYETSNLPKNLGYLWKSDFLDRCFVVTFILYRLLFGTYGTLLLWHNVLLNPGVDMIPMLVAIVQGFLLHYMNIKWFTMIWKKYKHLFTA